ncbi:MAG TPA: hypothetical protein VGN96_10415 [Roseococcus sp.]|jgi:hypothetical protein|nr:hypothetical protein [Roseococcus sp.]
MPRDDEAAQIARGLTLPLKQLLSFLPGWYGKDQFRRAGWAPLMRQDLMPLATKLYALGLVEMDLSEAPIMNGFIGEGFARVTAKGESVRAALEAMEKNDASP